VYARGAHTVAVAPEALASGGVAGVGRPRDKKSLEALNKRVELALEELGVRPPVTATRAVCRAWYALRNEVAVLLEVSPAHGHALMLSVALHSPAPAC
jgi:hypothetical protein